jgi:hypothetical protein
VANKIQIQMDSNKIQVLSCFDRSKKDLTELEKFKIKYSCVGFEEMNNFLYRNFFRFEMDFK